MLYPDQRALLCTREQGALARRKPFFYVCANPFDCKYVESTVPTYYGASLGDKTLLRFLLSVLLVALFLQRLTRFFGIVLER